MITRRTFLRGVGATVALPWLETFAHDQRAPTRLAVLFMPNGVLGPAWTPKGVGRAFELSPTLEPLAPHRDDILVLSGLRNANSRDGDGHYAKVAPLLTGCKIRRTGGRDLLNGVSMDQLAAQHVGHLTPLASLELGTEPTRSMEDMGYSTVYGAHIAWQSATQPMAKEIVPRLAFDRLFRSTQLRATRAMKSVLDVVLEDAQRLQPKLSRADRGKLDEYFTSVRALESRIERASLEPYERVDARLAPAPGIPGDFATHVCLMLDLIALAFATDTTRIVTFMFGNEVSGRDFAFLDGVTGGHHDLSHHEGKADKQRQYQLINRWYIAQLADLVAKLKRVQEAERSLLDNALVVFAGAMRDGNSHDPNDLPIVVAGRGGGTLATGAHVAFPDPTPLCNLWLSLLLRMDVRVDQFGDSTGLLL